MTFFLTIFGTFMTRSGIVQSVHAFGQDTSWPGCSRSSWSCIAARQLRLRHLPDAGAALARPLDSWLSREAAFLVNNWILLFAAFFILFATMFPTLSEALFGERITVGRRSSTSGWCRSGSTLLFLTGVGPLIAWRKATPSNLRYQFTFWPFIGARPRRSAIGLRRCRRGAGAAAGDVVAGRAR